MADCKKTITDKTHKTHYLKHNGLKSVIALDKGKVVVTAFGEKNKAVLKYGVSENEWNCISGNEDKTRIDAILEVNGSNINFKNDKVEKNFASVNRPDNYYASDEVRRDLIGLKDKLEKQFFGKTFNDNLHVQIAYNLLDIQKIFGLHVGNVVNAVSQLLRHTFGKEGDPLKNDIVGTTWSHYLFDDYGRSEKGYMDFKKRNSLLGSIEQLYPYNRYFDSVLKTYPFERSEDGFTEKDMPEEKKNRLRHNYYVILILSYLRQISEHIQINIESNKGDGWKNNLEVFFSNDGNRKLDKKGLNKIVVAETIIKKDIEKVIEDFIKHSEKNLYILSQVIPNEKKLTEKYIDYRFSKKNVKNLGVNIKKIREKLLENKEVKPELKHKVNLCVDFYLWYYYSMHEDELNSFVVGLRCSISDTEKEEVYDLYSGKINYSDIESIVDAVDRNIKEKSLNYSMDEGVVKKCFENLFQIKSDIAKHVYVMTKFMDKKEVNELLNTMVSKLSNIESLVDVAKGMNIWNDSKFIDKYGGLNSVSSFVNDFEVVLKLALLKADLKKEKVRTKEKEDSNAIGRRLYLDALEIFDGMEKCDDDPMLKIILPEAKNDEGKKDTKLRNFLASSVINNRRFAYLLKTIDTKYCRRIIDNESVVKFILMRGDMPDSIVESYYIKITKSERPLGSRKQMVDIIYDELKNVSLNTFELQGKLLRQDGREMGTTKKQLTGDLVRNKELITLYLTICYLFAKGMSHANSVYTLAWSALERDNYYSNNKKNVKDYLELSDNYVSELEKSLPHLDKNSKIRLKKSVRNKMHNYGYLKQNQEECKKLIDIEKPFLAEIEAELKAKEKKGKTTRPNFIRICRNVTAHFNVLEYCLANGLLSKIKMNYDSLKEKDEHSMYSYFAIYNYAMQHNLINYYEGHGDMHMGAKFPFSSKVNYLDKGFYDKDLLKIMYYPFAYNLARYKNLTIEDLFNDKYPVSKDKNE